MRIAVVGSRGVTVKNLEQYLPPCDGIISGGAKGEDACAAEYAHAHGIALVELLPQYDLYGRAAPIVRNREIVDMADEIVAFWDGASKGTKSVIDYANRIGKPCRVIYMDRSGARKP